MVKAPRVAESPAHMECRVLQIVDLPAIGNEKNAMVIGTVLGIHIRDDLIVDGRVDIVKVRPVGRLGYFDYCVVSESFELLRPSWPLNAPRPSGR